MTNSKKNIAVISTLDTKGPEAAFVKSRIEGAGHGVVLLDTGILDRRDPSTPQPDISADDIAREGGEDRAELAARSSEKETRKRGIRARLEVSLTDPQLSGVRDPEALEQLPYQEAQAWREYWDSARELVGRVAKDSNH